MKTLWSVLAILFTLLFFADSLPSQETNQTSGRIAGGGAPEQADASGGGAQAGENNRILGEVPRDTQKSITNQFVWVRLGGQNHSTEDLVESAVRWLLRKEKGINVTKLRADVFIGSDEKGEILADIVLGQGIGKPCWTISLNSQLEVVKFRKGTGIG